MDVKEKARRLKQFRDLKREIDQLSQRIARLESELDSGGACRWRGRVSIEHRARLIELHRRLALRRASCMEQLEALFGFINGIDDSLTRQIMAFRYIDGLTWRQVAAHIGEREEQYPRRMHNRCLARLELPPQLIRQREDPKAPATSGGEVDHGEAN